MGSESEAVKRLKAEMVMIAWQNRVADGPRWDTDIALVGAVRTARGGLRTTLSDALTFVEGFQYAASLLSSLERAG